MLFSSNEFLFLFLPVSLILYFVVPKRWKNFTLMAVSLVFYGWGEPIYLFLMIFTIISNYVFGYFVAGAYERHERKKRVLVISIVTNLCILGFFKYADFVLLNLAKIPLLSGIRPLGISLPIGISFYTFQSMSYVIDVYRGDAKLQKNIINFASYVTMFPQLIAGPIVRYTDIDRELEDRCSTVDGCAEGAERFVCGLAKKVLLANTAGELWESIRDIPKGQGGVVLAWIGIACFAAQIYFDFSGYSDMGIGLGKIFGFRFPENFNYPYTAKSISDFWRRWHITLSTYFKEYVYIPLGGNRVSRGRLVFNLFVTWSLTGLWHGASWNFIIWGIYYFALLTVEKLFLGKYLEKMPVFLRHAYTLFFVSVGWLIFAFEDSSAGFEYFKVMFGFGGVPFFTADTGYEIVRNLLFFAVLCVAATPYPRRFVCRMLSEGGRKSTLCHAFLGAGSVALFLLCTAYLADSSYNPFLYFRF